MDWVYEYMLANSICTINLSNTTDNAHIWTLMKGINK